MDSLDYKELESQKIKEEFGFTPSRSETSISIKKDAKDMKKNVLTLDVNSVVDVLDTGDKLIYLTNDGNTTDKITIGNTTYSPPPKNDLPYFLADKNIVLSLISGNSDSSDSNLYTHLLEYHKKISDLPDELYYDLLVLWDFHTYLLDKLHFSPVLYLYAVKERGKSRTGKGCIYVSRRGVFTETVREPDIIRWGNDHRAALGFDVKDFPKKIQRANCDDLILARFERGSISSRTLWPEKGAFKDTKNFRLFGPTIVMTNRPVDDILESRSISIDMKPSQRVFNNPVIPEDALELKARLTAFRFMYRNTLLKEVDRPLPGRLGDILSPLLQLVHSFFPERLDNFTKLLRLIAEKKQEEAIDTFEAQVVEAVIKAEGQVDGGLLAIDSVTSLFNEGKSERFAVSNETIGRILRGLGFTPRRLTGGKRGIYYDQQLVKNIASQYGIKDISGLPSLPSLASKDTENSGEIQI